MTAAVLLFLAFLMVNFSWYLLGQARALHRDTKALHGEVADNLAKTRSMVREHYLDDEP